MTLYDQIDAWFSTVDGLMFAAIAGFIAAALIPVIILGWALRALILDARARRRRKIADEVEKAITGKLQIITRDTPARNN